MIRAKKILREGQALLEREIITLVRQGKTMNTEDCVFGYVVNVDDDTMLEAEVKSLAIVNDKLHCKKQVFDQQFSEKLDSADFGKLVLHIVIDKAVMQQRAAASLLGA